MGRQDEIVKERIEKLHTLRKAGINPYPNKFEIKDKSLELHDKHSKLKKGEKSKYKAKLAGRLMNFRDFGKIAFGVLYDGHGKIQVTLQSKNTPEKVFKSFKEFIDVGDFIGIEGIVHRTERGELSILANKVELLSKSILPLPEKWHGLQDKEERYRKRYLDLIMGPEVKKVFERRTQIIDAIREFLRKDGYVEVETPVLQPLYGGGAARPFTSELNSLKMQVYLAVSKELYLKRLIVGGFNKVYEMNKVFRNEGIDVTHNPEFTILETMWGYANYNDNMGLFEEMIEHVARSVLKKTKIEYQGKEIELKKPWKRMTIGEAIKKYAKIDVDKMSDKELLKFIEEKNIKLKTDFRRGVAIEEIFSEMVQPHLIQPHIIYDYPADTSPLAKRKESNPQIAERFEPIINGWEMGNNYSELNEPILLRKIFEEQAEFKNKGDEEAAPYDEDFVNALEIGMPPTSGLGLGVDRLVMLLTNQASIRDVILFPFMRPEGMKEEKEGKAQESKMAVVILNNSIKLEPWERMNTIAHLNASFAGRLGKQLFLQDTIETKDNKKLKLNIQHAIMIKEGSSKEIKDLLNKPDDNLEVFVFTREMIETTDDKKVIEWTKNKESDKIEYLGTLIFGKKSKLEELTKHLHLLKK